MRILLTRPLEQSKRSADRLSALGHQPLVAAFIEIVAFDPMLPEGRFDAVLATSGNALLRIDAHARTVTRLPICVVGERTALLARLKGWTAIEKIARDAGELTEFALAQNADRHWLYLAGSPRNPVLELAFDEAGRNLTALLAYEARPAPAMPISAAAALRAGAIDAVLHYSERSAAAFVALARRAELIEPAADPVHVVISRRAAAPLLGFAKKVVVSKSPDEDAMFAELARLA